MAEFTIESADPEEGRALLEASHALMRQLFNPEDNHFLSLDQLRAPDITLLLARDAAGGALGCGAMARRDRYGEIKSMFTAPAARGRGVAEALLTELEALARAEGLPCLRLETGTGLDAAHRLYERFGFSTIGPFGAYEDSPYSVFMEKRLD